MVEYLGGCRLFNFFTLSIVLERVFVEQNSEFHCTTVDKDKSLVHIYHNVLFTVDLRISWLGEDAKPDR